MRIETSIADVLMVMDREQNVKEPPNYVLDSGQAARTINGVVITTAGDGKGKWGGAFEDKDRGAALRMPIRSWRAQAAKGRGRHSKNVPNETAVGQWHDLQVTVAGDTLSVAIDGKEAGSFSSLGMAHPTKKMLRLSVPRNAVVDDMRIYRKG